MPRRQIHGHQLCRNEQVTRRANVINFGSRHLDHVVSSAGCGEQALLLACSSPWDVIILDRMLPELDGLTLLRTLRGRGVMTPVLMLTGRHLKVCAPDNDLADIMRTLAMPRV